MSVLLETSVGDLVLDLETELCPRTTENFLKLCKTYYYNFCSFFNVQRDFIAQTGDPTDLGTGGESIYSQLKPSAEVPHHGHRYFDAELAVQKAHSKILNHAHRGTLSMAVADGKCASQFFLTLSDRLEDLDGKHVVFGRLAEGLDTLDKINAADVDSQGRPMRDIRLRHVIVLDDPFDDPVGISIPAQSPTQPRHSTSGVLRINDDEELDEEIDPAVVEERRRERDARAQALTLEMVGDLPFAEVAPPENILFICKLNSITRSEDLELIFSRFGTILSCEVIKDGKTGDSLQYAFIEFDKKEDAERAYFKMEGVLIDDRRIHVDFSQSVSKLHSDWVFKRTGRRMSTKQTGRPTRQAAHVAFSAANANSKFEMSFDEADLIQRRRPRDKHRDHNDEQHSLRQDRSAQHRNSGNSLYRDRKPSSRRRSRSPVSRGS